MSNVTQDLTDFIKDKVPLSERHSGYITDITGISLAENEDGSATSWVHALSLGEFRHPFWGKLKFDAKRIKNFADSVTNRVRGIDLAIDYSHNSDGEAAGWVQSAEARPNGLWLLVEWTAQAAEQIKAKRYRYFSSDFADEWEDSSGTKHTDVLFGGGLTNRPFLKNLVPVNLSELQATEREEEEDEPMKELLKALGLSEDATEEEALDALKQLSETPPPPTPPQEEEDDKLKTLAESNPEVKALMDRVTELETGARFTEAKTLVDGWSIHSTTKFALPEAVTTQLTDALIKTPGAIRSEIEKVFDHILEHGLVSLSESGRKRLSTDDPKPEGTAVSRFDAAVKKLMEENDKMSFSDAVAEVSRDEELYMDYRRETISGTVMEETEEVSD